MYLRKNPKAGKDGSKIEYYQIAHNHRDPGTKKSKCTIVRGIGRVDNPEVREALLGLCITIAQEYKLKIHDPAGAEFEPKASKINEIIPLEDVRQSATEKLALKPTKLREGMVQLCQSIAKTFNLQTYDPSDLNHNHNQQMISKLNNNISIDRLRQAAQDINNVLGLDPKIDPRSHWDHTSLLYAITITCEMIEPGDDIKEDTLNVLADLRLLNEQAIYNIRSCLSNVNSLHDHTIGGNTSDSNRLQSEETTASGKFTREQLQRAALDLNKNVRFEPKFKLTWPDSLLEQVFENLGKDLIVLKHHSQARKHHSYVIEGMLEENTLLVLYTLGSLSSDLIAALKKKYPNASFPI